MEKFIVLSNCIFRESDLIRVLPTNSNWFLIDIKNSNGKVTGFRIRKEDFVSLKKQLSTKESIVEHKVEFNFTEDHLKALRENKFLHCGFKLEG